MGSTPEESPTDGASATEEKRENAPQSAENDKDLAEFEHWLESEGPQSENARTVLLDAARILDEQGPLEAYELRQQLLNCHPEAYASAEALWVSTVERLHNELPGFDRPAYGTSAFNRENADRN